MSLHFGTLHFTTPPWCTKSPAAEADEGELEKGFEDAGGGSVAQGEGEGAEGRGVHAVGEAAAHAHVVPAGDVAFQAFGVWILLMEEVELAYAITVHKSQGSEYPAVVIPLLSGPRMLMNRNLLYTAVTRGKRAVVLVGSENKLQAMVDNNRISERFSGLGFRLKRFLDMDI